MAGSAFSDPAVWGGVICGGNPNNEEVMTWGHIPRVKTFIQNLKLQPHVQLSVAASKRGSDRGGIYRDAKYNLNLKWHPCLDPPGHHFYATRCDRAKHTRAVPNTLREHLRSPRFTNRSRTAPLQNTCLRNRSPSKHREQPFEPITDTS